MSNIPQRRIIINIRSASITDADAAERVQAVIRKGRISETAGRKQYSLGTLWESGVIVVTMPKRLGTTDTFVVYREGEYGK